jgi:mono/diheme cytochrome c family protein
MVKNIRGNGGFGRLLAGFLLGVLTVAVAGIVYLRFGTPPVATADKPFFMEKSIVSIPLHVRMDREQKAPPFGISEDVFENGAETYKENCVGCHGSPGHHAPAAQDMYPAAPQLWDRHHGGKVVGVSDDPPGETYWKVANGIRLSGMPSFHRVLTETQMWQVSLLLANADQQLPDPVMKILTTP